MEGIKIKDRITIDGQQEVEFLETKLFVHIKKSFNINLQTFLFIANESQRKSDEESNHDYYQVENEEF